MKRWTWRAHGLKYKNIARSTQVFRVFYAEPLVTIRRASVRTAKEEDTPLETHFYGIGCDRFSFSFEPAKLLYFDAATIKKIFCERYLQTLLFVV